MRFLLLLTIDHQVHICHDHCWLWQYFIEKSPFCYNRRFVSGLMCEILWSDPQDQLGLRPSKRGKAAVWHHLCTCLALRLKHPISSVDTTERFFRIRAGVNNGWSNKTDSAKARTLFVDILPLAAASPFRLEPFFRRFVAFSKFFGCIFGEVFLKDGFYGLDGKRTKSVGKRSSTSRGRKK